MARGVKSALRETGTRKLWRQTGILTKHNKEIYSELPVYFGSSAFFFIQNVRKRL